MIANASLLGQVARFQTAFVVNDGADQRQGNRHIEVEVAVRVDGFACVRARAKKVRYRASEHASANGLQLQAVLARLSSAGGSTADQGLRRPDALRNRGCAG